MNVSGKAQYPVLCVVIMAAMTYPILLLFLCSTPDYYLFHSSTNHHHHHCNRTHGTLVVLLARNIPPGRHLHIYLCVLFTNSKRHIKF